MAAAVFVICLAENGLKIYGTVQLLFGCDTILAIKHRVNWEIIRQQNRAQINKGSICKNQHKIGHNYKVGYKVMIKNSAAYK